jgi:hypothetical protein
MRLVQRLQHILPSVWFHGCIIVTAAAATVSAVVAVVVMIVVTSIVAPQRAPRRVLNLRHPCHPLTVLPLHRFSG